VYKITNYTKVHLRKNICKKKFFYEKIFNKLLLLASEIKQLAFIQKEKVNINTTHITLLHAT